jgi:ceramide glucosyltransferase
MLTSGSPVWWIVACAGTVVTLVGTFCAWRRSRQRVRSALSPFDPGVTVMKPLSGVDPSLEDNLETFAKLRSPAPLEVLLCLRSEADPAYPLAREFVERFPHRFRIALGAAPSLGNAKLAQLAAAWSEVKHPLIWVSESNVETSQAFFEALVITWREANEKGRVKTLVHAPLVGVGGDGVGAAFERMHLASFQNANHELALFLHMHAVVGKTEFFHRDDLTALGGFHAFGQFLGEDYLMGEAFAREGVVRCLPLATRNVLGNLNVRPWFERHERWAVMRKLLVGPAFYFLEPLVLLSWPALLWLAGLVPFECFALCLLARVFIDGFNWAIHAKAWPPGTDLFLVPFKEALLFVAWLRAVFSSQVKWRASTSIELGPRSEVRPASAER